MALYYLDAQDANYPYQVVRKRLSDGGYVGQMPMSASLVAFSEGKVSGTAQVTVLPMGGLGSTTIQLNDYDWASCLPEPAAYTTDAEIMAYLSTLFTGQLGTLVPPTPTPQTMIYNTTPIISVDGSSGIDSYIPLDAGDGIPTAAFENIGTIGVESTITQIITTISRNTLDQPARIVLMQDGIELADAEATGGAEVLSFNILSDQISDNSLIYFKLRSTSTTGLLGITSIMTKVILTEK